MNKRISPQGATCLGYVTGTYLKSWHNQSRALRWLEVRRPKLTGSASWDDWWEAFWHVKKAESETVETVRDLGGLLLLTPAPRADRTAGYAAKYAAKEARA